MSSDSRAAPRKAQAASRKALNRSAAILSVGVAIGLLAIKGYAAWATGSTAMLGSLADTALDIIASIVSLIGVWVAAIPADHDHRYGHGKAEALAAMVQVVLISISAVGIAARAVEQWLGGARAEEPATGIAVSAVAIGMTLVLLAWQRHVIRRTGSLAVRTDHVHYQSDLLLNLAVIVALALDGYAGIAGADPVFALGIAVWLAWNAWRASQSAVEQLMDKEWPTEKRERLLDMICDHPGLRGVHELRTRTSGDRDFAQFHVWIDGRMTLAAAHRVMDEIEAILARAFPDTEFMIHPEPEGAGEGNAPPTPADPRQAGDRPGSAEARASAAALAPGLAPAAGPLSGRER